MRYNQDSNPSSLTIETQPQPSGIFQAAPQSILNTSTGYSSDAGSLYSFQGLNFRHRVDSSNTPSTGMVQGHRPTTALPQPVYNTRDIYRSAPLFPRGPEHTQRSPTFGAPSRRHPLSPTPSPSIGYPTTSSSIRMDGSAYGKGTQQHIPPLQPIVTHGQLLLANNHHTHIKMDIHGTIDKGFFLSDGEWTCYRRNYFSCICSYTLTPNYGPSAALQYTPNQPNSSGTVYDVYGFAMSISAVVAESDSHSIELVQHTPKRDKGPISRPDKVPLSPKQQQTHPLGSGLYPDTHRLGMGSSSGDMYATGFTQPQGGSHATEHTFERIQFKQATANNGKRRAAQQYYHLLVELYANVGEAGRGTAGEWMRIAHRKSAKMIVRGRSPGHYQTERRGSTSSGPGGSSGTLGSYTGSQGLGDYSSGPSLLGPGSYGVGGYDPRSGHYGSSRHHDLSFESAQDMKDDAKDAPYRYYPGLTYDGADPRQPVEMFRHNHDQDTTMTSMPGTAELPRVKHESDSLRNFYLPGPAYHSRGCSQLESKSSSVGWYPMNPMMVPQSSAVP